MKKVSKLRFPTQLFSSQFSRFYTNESHIILLAEQTKRARTGASSKHGAKSGWFRFHIISCKPLIFVIIYWKYHLFVSYKVNEIKNRYQVVTKAVGIVTNENKMAPRGPHPVRVLRAYRQRMPVNCWLMQAS